MAQSVSWHLIQCRRDENVSFFSRLHRKRAGDRRVSSGKKIIQSQNMVIAQNVPIALPPYRSN